jgi:Flp pilus assembly protein TadD
MEDLVEIGVNECKAGNFEGAVVHFTKALAKEAKNIPALYNRARAYSKTDQLDKALLDFETLTEISPDNATFIGDYAVALHLCEMDEKAELHFELALKLEPENPYRYSSRAFYKDRMGDYKGAIKDYEKAIALDPEDEIAYNNKGLIEEKLGYKEKAEKSFQKSNKIVGYEPKSGDRIDTSNKSRIVETKLGVIKSLTTKHGFNDFLRFSKNLFNKNNDNN